VAYGLYLRLDVSYAMNVDLAALWEQTNFFADPIKQDKAPPYLFFSLCK
jgi:hypothetical protein